MRFSPATAKPPIFCQHGQVGPHRITLDIAKHGTQMIVLFDRKRLESTLVEMSRALRLVMCMPAHRVRVRKPTEKTRQLILAIRPHYKMPMIWHHTIRENRQGFPFKRLFKYKLERFVVFDLFEQRKPSNRSIEHMKASSGGTNAWAARHFRIIAD